MKHAAKNDARTPVIAFAIPKKHAHCSRTRFISWISSFTKVFRQLKNPSAITGFFIAALAHPDYLNTKIMKAIKLLLFIVLVGGCEKEELVIYSNACVECTRYHKPTIDTCGGVQEMNSLVLQFEHLGYDCKTKYN